MPSFFFFLKKIQIFWQWQIKEKHIRGEIVAIKFQQHGRRSECYLEQRRGMCICLWKCAPPLRQWVCPWRDRGREGSGGTQVIEVSPPLPFFSRAAHPPSHPPHHRHPIHTAGTITLPITPPAGPRDPTLLTKRDSIGPFPLNLSAPALGEWWGCTQNWGGGGLRQFDYFQSIKQKDRKKTEIKLS